MDEWAIEVRSLCKTFAGRRALNEVSLTVRRGEMVALLGASGSGKSTLLRHLSGMLRSDPAPDSRVRVLGRDVQTAGRLAADVRATRSRVAFIFQQFNLVDRLPVMVNVMAGALHRLPLWRGLCRVYPAAELRRAHEALVRVGIDQCAWQRASTLSGGQQQRAAISRALVQGAEIILADEPIASLDPASSHRVLELLAEVNRESGTTVLVSLHQVDFAFAFCPRTVALRAGRVVYDGPTVELTQERLRELYGTDVAQLYEGSAAEVRPTRRASAGMPMLEPA
jgi:phosphonate transport system ATP-binding protein